MIRAPPAGFQGAKFAGRVGPNQATMGVPTAAAMCIGPLSGPTKTAARRMSSAVPARSSAADVRQRPRRLPQDLRFGRLVFRAADEGDPRSRDLPEQADQPDQVVGPPIPEAVARADMEDDQGAAA